VESEAGHDMTRLRKFAAGILGTLAAAGIYLGAIWYHQKPVAMPPLPVAAVSSHEWVLTNDYKTAQSGYTFRFKTGFRTDFASIPAILSPALGLDAGSACLRRGALIHDGCYAARLTDKDTADGLLRDAVRQDGCEPHKADAVWQAVHNWGYLAWDGKTPDSISEARRLVTVSRSE